MLRLLRVLVGEKVQPQLWGRGESRHVAAGGPAAGLEMGKSVEDGWNFMDNHR